jgi:hypothetical protein
MAKSISPADPSSEPQISPIHSFFSGTSRRILIRRPFPNRFRRRPYWGRPITFFPSDLRPQGRESHPRPSKSRGRGQKPRSRTRPLYGGTQSTAGTLFRSTPRSFENRLMAELATQHSAAHSQFPLDHRYGPVLARLEPCYLSLVV